MPRLPLAEAVERLQSPFALEAFSPLAGAPILIVDCRGPERVAADALAIAGARLGELPCPTVAIVGAAVAPIVDRFDVVVSSEDDLAPIVAVVARAPLAAATLVQLLRHNAGLDTDRGLLGESLAYSTLQAGPECRAWLASRGLAAPAARSAEPAVLVSRRGGRLDLVLNRPARRNALSVEMRDALVAGLRLAASDPTIGEVVLRGNGPAFCAGGDLDEFGTLPDPATAHAVRATRGPARALAAIAERVTVELHGACVGAGIELPAFARRVVATPDAFFQLPEVAMGLVPGAGGTVSIPRRVGRQRTAWLCLSAARLDAATALAWGLVDEVVGGTA
jgi:enoyl-CoA hydratase/carnithine racemase